jgi:hypothetical protein
VWSYVVLCDAVWSYVVLCGAVWPYVVLCGDMWCCVVLCGAVWCCVVLCGAVWCCVVLCGAVTGSYSGPLALSSNSVKWLTSPRRPVVHYGRLCYVLFNVAVMVYHSPLSQPLRHV